MSREKLLRDLTAAMAAAKTKLSAFKLDDVPDDNYITQFGQENLGEYLGYVASLKLWGEKIFKEEELERLAASAGLTSKDLESRKLFHYFLFELNSQKAESAAAAENQTIKKLDPKVPVTRYEVDSSGDLSEELVVGNWRAHYSETIGRRAGQEDAFVIGAAKQDDGWENSVQVPSLLQKQFQEMGVQIRNYCIDKDKGERSGSTAIAAHYSKDRKLTIANLGDSRAVLFVRKADGEVEWIRLTNDQEPNDVFEQARIEAKGGFVWRNRVNGQLMVGRSFGDVFIQAGGDDEGKMLISYEPDIYQHDIAQILSDYGANSQAFLMTSCDGMYDHGKGNEATYAQALTDWFSNAEEREKHKNNMAEYLRDYAISLGSEDNVTVCISDITEAPLQSVVTAVFDGHGGSKVSAIAAEAFAQNVLHDRSAAIVHHADNSGEIRIIVEGRAAAVGVTESVALAKIQAKIVAEDIWKQATPIKIEEVEIFEAERAADSAEGGSLEKFKSSKDLARFIVERHAKFNFEEQGGFNKAFGLTPENPPSVEDYIRDKLKVASKKKENVTDFLAKATSGAEDLQFGNDRSFHGAYHSIITTVYTGMFADFYSKHFAGKFGIPDGGLSEEKRNLAMVMTSAHDIARNKDGMLTDEHNNAFYLALILRDHLELPQDEAIALASHIAKKDSPGDFAKKSIYSRLTQCADCAAIVRVYGSGEFNETMLDARKDINEMSSSPEKSAAEADLKSILDFAKAFEDKMREKKYAGYKVNNTTFDGATRYLRAVAKGISKDPTEEGQKAFLGYLDGLSNEPKSEFISSATTPAAAVSGAINLPLPSKVSSLSSLSKGSPKKARLGSAAEDLRSRNNQNFAYSDREINAVNVARNKRDGISYHVSSNRLLTGILKKDSCFVRNENGMVVELPACDASGEASPIYDRLKEQFDHLLELKAQNEEIYPLKILFPYKVVAWHWNAGEIVVTEVADKKLMIKGTAYDSQGGGRLYHKIQDDIKSFFEEKFGKSNVIFDLNTQSETIGVQKGGVACGLYAALAIHNLKTKGNSQIWDGVIDGDVVKVVKDDRALRNEDSLLIIDHGGEAALVEFCAPLDERGFKSVGELSRIGPYQEEEERANHMLGLIDEKLNRIFNEKLNRIFNEKLLLILGGIAFPGPEGEGVIERAYDKAFEDLAELDGFQEIFFPTKSDGKRGDALFTRNSIEVVFEAYLGRPQTEEAGDEAIRVFLPEGFEGSESKKYRDCLELIMGSYLRDVRGVARLNESGELDSLIEEYDKDVLTFIKEKKLSDAGRDDLIEKLYSAKKAAVAGDDLGEDGGMTVASAAVDRTRALTFAKEDKEQWIASRKSVTEERATAINPAENLREGLLLNEISADQIGVINRRLEIKVKAAGSLEGLLLQVEEGALVSEYKFQEKAIPLVLLEGVISDYRAELNVAFEESLKKRSFDEGSFSRKKDANKYQVKTDEAGGQLEIDCGYYYDLESDFPSFLDELPKTKPFIGFAPIAGEPPDELVKGFVTSAIQGWYSRGDDKPNSLDELHTQNKKAYFFINEASHWLSVEIIFKKSASEENEVEVNYSNPSGGKESGCSKLAESFIKKIAGCLQRAVENEIIGTVDAGIVAGNAAKAYIPIALDVIDVSEATNVKIIEKHLLEQATAAGCGPTAKANLALLMGDKVKIGKVEISQSDIDGQGMMLLPEDELRLRLQDYYEILKFDDAVTEAKCGVANANVELLEGLAVINEYQRSLGVVAEDDSDDKELNSAEEGLELMQDGGRAIGAVLNGYDLFGHPSLGDSGAKLANSKKESVDGDVSYLEDVNKPSGPESRTEGFRKGVYEGFNPAAEEAPNLGSEIERMRVEADGKITLDFKNSETGESDPVVIKQRQNRFVEVVIENSEKPEVKIKSEDFRKELMDYYNKKNSYEVGEGKKAKNIGKDALEVLNIYRAVPSTSCVPRASVALNSASRIVVGDLSKTR